MERRKKEEKKESVFHRIPGFHKNLGFDEGRMDR
jgi:hypothetical protein